MFPLRTSIAAYICALSAILATLFYPTSNFYSSFSFQAIISIPYTILGTARLFQSARITFITLTRAALPSQPINPLVHHTYFLFYSSPSHSHSDSSTSWDSYLYYQSVTAHCLHTEFLIIWFIHNHYLIFLITKSHFRVTSIPTYNL